MLLVAIGLLAGCASSPASHTPTATTDKSPDPLPADAPGPWNADLDTEAPIETVQVLPLCQPAPLAAKPKPKPAKRPPPVVSPEDSTPSAPARDETADASGALKNVRPINPGEVLSVLGKKVWGPNGDDLGRVVDLLIDPTGRIRSAVIDFGGFLGVGNRKIAVDWTLLKFRPASAEKQVVLTLDREQVLAAPEYTGGERSAEVIAPAAKHGS